MWRSYENRRYCYFYLYLYTHIYMLIQFTVLKMWLLHIRDLRPIKHPKKISKILMGGGGGEVMKK